MDRIQRLQQMLITESDKSFLMHALALEYAAINNYLLARDTWITLLEGNTNYLPAYYQLGKVLEKIGDINTAITIYKKGMEIAKNNRDQKTYAELEFALEDLE